MSRTSTPSAVTGLLLSGVTPLLIVLISACPSPAPRPPPRRSGGAPPTVATVAERICRAGDRIPDAVFAARFRARVSADRVRVRLRQLQRDHGPCRRVHHGSGPHLRWVHDRATIPGRLYLGRDGRVIGLWFARPRFPNDTLAALTAAFGRLPGRVGLTVREAGQPNAVSIRSGTPLAVASSFKLTILEALANEIAQGRMRWDDVVYLDPKRRSLAPRNFRRWPARTPLTLATLATMMISRSDNTATDHLLFHLGRPLVERFGGPRNRPFLSTLEAFKLKSPNQAALARRYAGEDEAGRRALLKALARLPRSRIQPLSKPAHIDRIEWFYSTDQLCDTILKLRGVELLGVNRGLVDDDPWASVAYKGGSEPGVRNMTYALKHRSSGQWLCISATWNDPLSRIDRHTFDTLVSRLIQLASRSGRLPRPAPRTGPARRP